MAQRVRENVSAIVLYGKVIGRFEVRAVVVVVELAQIAAAWRVKDETVKGQNSVAQAHNFQRELRAVCCYE